MNNYNRQKAFIKKGSVFPQDAHENDLYDNWLKEAKDFLKKLKNNNIPYHKTWLRKNSSYRDEKGNWTKDESINGITVQWNDLRDKYEILLDALKEGITVGREIPFIDGPHFSKGI